MKNNNMASTHPHLAAEWHPTKNGSLTPSDVAAGTNKKVWWLGKCGHEWEAVGASRSTQGTGCPYCSNSRVLAGFNDFATVNPDLAAEWHPTKNGSLKPSDYLPKTAAKIWWLGKCGHEWEAALISRSSLRGTGCPICANQKVLAGFNDLASLFPDVAAEWHPTQNGSLKPDEVIKGSNKKFWWLCKNGHEWDASASSRTGRNSGCPICSNQRIKVGENDFATTSPDLAAEWHPTKNGSFTPNEVGKSSEKKVWWLGQCGHEWFAQIAPRTQQGVGCPICSGHKILIGFNDFATTNPDLAAEWHPTKNGELTPQGVVRGTRKKAWWFCKNGHEWEAIIANRVWGNGCPYCSHQWLLEGENDLLTLEPELARQWHPTKNGNLTPDKVFSTTGKKYWWICDQGHEWDAKVSNRKSLGLGCPICAGQRLLPGLNDLATTHPDLAAEWHPTKNGSLKPSQVFPKGDFKYWWLGKCGHEWNADVGSRASGNKCPICSNQKVLLGFNDMGTTHPDLAAEWHPTKNGNLTPSDVIAGTNKKVWWLGKCGHEWDAVGSSRVVGNACPVCSNQKLLAGFNDLATLGGELLKEWHPTKNKDTNPANVIGPSGKKYWWVCDKGHEWSASSGARLRGTGCPTCSAGGYSTASPGVFYFIESRSLNARKVGVANQTSSRLANWLELGWTLVHEVRSDDGLHILNLETMTLRWIRKDIGLPPYLGKEEMGRPGGWSETFSMEGVANLDVIRKVAELEQELASYGE
jgi:hypothetical protein